MKLDQIKLIYEYNYWADQRILSACASVSDAQYIADTNFGNLRQIIVHMLDAVTVWRNTFQGEDVSAWVEFTVTDYPTLSEVVAALKTEEQKMRTYLNSLTDDDLNGVVRYKIESGTIRERVLWHCLYHLVNHGTQHRSEAAALLTHYGQSPSDLDFTVFLNEHFHLSA